jgi:hypothetical protein
VLRSKEIELASRSQEKHQIVPACNHEHEYAYERENRVFVNAAYTAPNSTHTPYSGCVAGLAYRLPNTRASSINTLTPLALESAPTPRSCAVKTHINRKY